MDILNIADNHVFINAYYSMLNQRILESGYPVLGYRHDTKTFFYGVILLKTSDMRDEVLNMTCIVDPQYRQLGATNYKVRSFEFINVGYFRPHSKSMIMCVLEYAEESFAKKNYLKLCLVNQHGSI